MDIVEAEGPVAFLAIEMYVGIFVMVGVMAQAELIAGAVHILDGMDQMAFPEKDKSAENA